MLSVILAVVAVMCFCFMMVALLLCASAYEKLERVEAELEECRLRNPSNPNRAGLRLVKGGSIGQRH